MFWMFLKISRIKFVITTIPSIVILRYISISTKILLQNDIMINDIFLIVAKLF